MKKDKALGRDPLGWIKATREADETVTREPCPVTRDPSPESRAPSHEPRVMNGSTIIFVVAYAVLLLVLTFFVYFNLSKRIDDMSSRISNIEKALSQGVGNRKLGR